MLTLHQVVILGHLLRSGRLLDVGKASHEDALGERLYVGMVEPEYPIVVRYCHGIQMWTSHSQQLSILLDE